MPKRVFKRLAPSQRKLREISSLRPLGEWIYEPNLWHINRISTSKAVAIGLFFAMIPAPGQMFIAAFVALRWRANLPVSVALVWVTNPLTMPFIYYLAYSLGAWMLGNKMQPVAFDISFQWLSESLINIWQPLLLGCVSIGLIAAIAGYTFTHLIWRWRVVVNWQKRTQRQDKSTVGAASDTAVKRAIDITKED